MSINLTCLHCGKIFIRKPYEKDIAKFCSKACQKEHKAAPKIILNCVGCGKQFDREVWKTKRSYTGSYCSLECYQSSRQGTVEMKCRCGKTFTAYKSRVKYYDSVFCCRQCYMKYGFHGRLTENNIDPNQYQQFLRQVRHTAAYLQWRKEVLELQGNQCSECSAKVGLTVHHKVPLIDFVREHGMSKDLIEADPRFFDTTLGVVLCRKHHLMKHIEKEIL